MSDLRKQIEALENERAAILEEIGPKQARMTQIASEIAALGKQLSNSWICEMGDTPDWPLIVRTLGNSYDPLNTTDLLRYTRKHLEEKFSMSESGYWPSTNEATLRIKLLYGSQESFQKNLAGVRFFTPILTPHKDGKIYFGIQSNNYYYSPPYLLVKPDFSEMTIIESSISKYIFYDLEQALKWVQDNLPYGWGG